MDAEQTAGSRGRQPRSEEEAQRRRRRGNNPLDAAKRLPIPPEIQAKLDREGLVPRWVNDEGNRIHRFTKQDDYDPVDGVEPVPVGTDKAGQPIMAHLLAKPRDFINQDQAEAETRRRELEEALFRQPDAVDAAGKKANPHGATAERYVTRNSGIERGNQILE